LDDQRDEDDGKNTGREIYNVTWCFKAYLSFVFLVIA
jgi:hypothetical protein